MFDHESGLVATSLKEKTLSLSWGACCSARSRALSIRDDGSRATLAADLATNQYMRNRAQFGHNHGSTGEGTNAALQLSTVLTAASDHDVSVGFDTTVNTKQNTGQARTRDASSLC